MGKHIQTNVGTKFGEPEPGENMQTKDIRRKIPQIIGVIRTKKNKLNLMHLGGLVHLKTTMKNGFSFALVSADSKFANQIFLQRYFPISPPTKFCHSAEKNLGRSQKSRIYFKISFPPFFKCKIEASVEKGWILE